MEILIVGGTGLLGQHSAVAALARDHHVRLLARHATQDVLPELADVPCTVADAGALSQEEWVRLLHGIDVVVYALGPDDRTMHPAPVSEFYARELVDRTEAVVAAARIAGVTRVVVLGSYFTTWARSHPDFAARHPYVTARLDQARRAIAAGGGGGDGTQVCVVEIPYVFGVVPGRVPMWKEWVFDRVRAMPIVFYPRGGSSAVTARQVGDVVAAACERGRHGQPYPVSDIDLSWPQMLRTILDAMGRRRPVVTIPRWLAEPTAWSMGRALARRGLESGIDPRWLMRDLMYTEMYVDASLTESELGFQRGGVTDAIVETVAASYPDLPMRAQRLGRRAFLLSSAVIVSLGLLVGCAEPKAPARLRMRVVATPWNGWDPKSSPRPQERSMDVSVGASMTITSVGGDVVFRVTDVSGLEVAFTTSTGMAEQGTGGGLDLTKTRDRFTVTPGSPIQFGTPTMDAGTTFTVSVVVG